MATNYSIDVLNPLFKQTYADEVQNAIPERELLLKSTPMVASEKMNGADYNQPVLLSRHHGMTYLGNSGQNLQLKSPIAAITQNASIRGSGMMLTGLLDTMAASRAMKGGPSFVDATSYLVEGMTDSFASIQEATHWYGGMGLATLTDISYTNTNAATDADGGFGDGTVTVFNSGTSSARVLLAREVVVPYKQWAPALWVGAENMQVDIVRSNSVVATLTIEAVDIYNRILTFSNISGYTPTANDVIYRNGSFGLESVGLQYILQKDGPLFGIDGDKFGLWKGSRFGVGATPSFKKVAAGIQIAYGRGLEGQLDLHVNSRTFSDLIPDFLTSKSTASDPKGREFHAESEIENIRHGSKAISFIVNNVECRLIANDYVKGGLMVGVAPDTLLRVGSSEITFDVPGSSEKGEYFRSKDGFAAVELRMFSDQALFCKAPARNILFTDVTVTKE